MENKDPLKQDTIKTLEQDLYSQDFKSDITSRSELTSTEVPAQKQWQHKPEPQLIVEASNTEKNPRSFIKKVLIIASIFFVICAVVTGFIFYGGLNLVSTSKVDIRFEGPVSIAAGQELVFDVVITNDNRTALVNPQLYIDFPDGTKQAAALSEDLLHTKDALEDIPSKTTSKRTVHAVLFGKQSSEKEIMVTLEYGVKASNGIFKKEKTYKVNISSTPLTMNISHPTEIGSGQDVSFSVDVVSNSNVALTNLALKADYPRGFTFKDAVPEALDTTVWKIPLLKPGEKKTIVINGKLEGEENDERVFRFNVGIQDELNDKAISTSFLTLSESLKIRRPPLATQLTFNNTTAQNSIVSPGQNIQGKIVLTNNMKEEIVDIEASVVFSGNAFESTSPNAADALYRLPTKTLLWDETTQSALNSLAPGNSVTLSFALSTLPQSVLSGIKNGQINISFKARGTAINSGQSIVTEATRITRVQPSFRVVPQITYSMGPFTNTGPIPAKAETKTTYTVTWRATHTSNEVSNVEVHGSLPSYVKWLNVISPGGTDIRWIPERNEIVWYAGTIPPGTPGLTAKEVSFQVEVYPSYNQIGTAPIVVDNIWYKGVDVFTGVTLSSPSSQSLTTYLPLDPQFKSYDGKVIE